jgi:hypothetical protein
VRRRHRRGGLRAWTDGSWLHVACNCADYHLISAATESVVDTVNTGLAPTEFKFNDETNCGFMPSPFGGDRLNIVRMSRGLEGKVPAGALGREPSGAPKQVLQPIPLP